MAKRSNFRRRKQDAYQTIDPRAVQALLPHLNGITKFAEPCAGELHLVKQLRAAGLVCNYLNDIAWSHGADSLLVRDFGDVDVIISNPPWTRKLLHQMIEHFRAHKQTWLLFDSDWAYNKLAKPFLPYCSDIVAVGRLRWIEDTTMQGKDNVSWYRFTSQQTSTTFHGRA